MKACGVFNLCVYSITPTLHNPMDCNLPGSSVHGISQARILEWVTILFSRGSSWPRDQIWVSCIRGGYFFNIWATWEAPQIFKVHITGVISMSLHSCVFPYIQECWSHQPEMLSLISSHLLMFWLPGLCSKDSYISWFPLYLFRAVS